MIYIHPKNFHSHSKMYTTRHSQNNFSLCSIHYCWGRPIMPAPSITSPRRFIFYVAYQTRSATFHNSATIFELTLTYFSLIIISLSQLQIVNAIEVLIQFGLEFKFVFIYLLLAFFYTYPENDVKKYFTIIFSYQMTNFQKCYLDWPNQLEYLKGF